MGYIKGYTYDIFISYSHVDNIKKPHQHYGWIEKFYDELNASLARRIGKTNAIKLWWDDKRLDGSILFDQSIAESVNNSAIMLCLVSPGYLESAYCKKELELFYNKAHDEQIGLSIKNRSRVINVLLNNIPHNTWPKELSGAEGFPFHDADTADSENYGETLEISSKKFKDELKILKEALIKLILSFPIPSQPPPSKFTIYFGDVSDSLRTVRKRTITELEKLDLKLIYDIPPPFEESEHEIAVKQKLKEANLAVHLLDQLTGRNIEGEETIWYPQKQAELGLQSPCDQLIWVPSELNIETVEEDAYRTFLQSLENGTQSSKSVKYIRGLRSEITQQITDIVKNIKDKLIQPEQGKISVLLDTSYDDQAYAWQLSMKLLENKIQPFINPQDDDPKKNISALEDRISQVDKLLFLYGKVSKDWVIERMKAALQFIAANNYPKKDFLVLMVPPHKDPNDISLKQQFIKVNIINNSDTPQLDFTALLSFFNSIKAVA
jgi:hypothetical protein